MADLETLRTMVRNMDVNEVMALEAIIHERMEGERANFAPLPAELQMLKDNNRIGAVKSVRARCHLGLREAVNICRSWPGY